MEVIKNWQEGVRQDGESPLPRGRGNFASDYAVDWAMYAATERQIGQWRKEVRSAFLAEYAPYKCDRMLRKPNKRYLKMAEYDLLHLDFDESN